MSVCTRISSYLYNQGAAAVRNAPAALSWTIQFAKTLSQDMNIRHFQLIPLAASYMSTALEGTPLLERCQWGAPVCSLRTSSIYNETEMVTEFSPIDCEPGLLALNVKMFEKKTTSILQLAHCGYLMYRGRANVIPFCKKIAKSPINAAVWGCDFTKRKVMPLCKQAAKSSIKAAVWGIEQIKEIGQSRGQRARSANATAVVRAVKSRRN